MLFAVICKDKEDALPIRLSTRMDHLRYIEESGVVQQAGPLLNQEGVMMGSLLILEVESLDAAVEWAAKDPYKAAGLFEAVTVTQWNRVIGE